MLPKKILHVANKAERLLGRRYYSLQYKINNGFIRNGHNVLWFSDRDTAKTSSVIPARSFGRRACNKKFVETCLNFKPEVIVFSHADLILPETVRQVKESLKDVRIFQYNIDGLYTQKNVESILSKRDLVEYTFMTTAGEALRQVSNAKSKACFMPNPVDSSIDIYRNWEKTEFDYDLFFVGGQIAPWLDPESMRALAIEHMPDDPPNTRVFMSTSTWGDDFMSTVGRTKMALNFNKIPSGQTPGPGGNLYMCSSDRISLCMGNGLLAFSDSRCSLSDLYGTDALVEVCDYDEFKDKYAYYSSHDTERIKIAKRGYELAHAEFNERLVTQYFLETVFGETYSYPYSWPTEQY